MVTRSLSLWVPHMLISEKIIISWEKSVHFFIKIKWNFYNSYLTILNPTMCLIPFTFQTNLQPRHFKATLSINSKTALKIFYNIFTSVNWHSTRERNNKKFPYQFSISIKFNVWENK